MCGIVGIFPFNSLPIPEADIRKEASLFLFTELLQQSQIRGEDATGVAALFENGDYILQKMGAKASDFISRFGGKNTDFEGFLNLCRTNKSKMSTLLGHCRKSSVGNVVDNENNHPIKVGELIGIHNGTLKNHDRIFKKLECKRDGTVDSEAIFRLLHHFTNSCTEPFTLPLLKEVVSRLDGTFSCLFFNANNPYQVGAFRDGRPMEFMLIKPLGILIAISEIKFAQNAVFVYNKLAALFERKFKILVAEDIECFTLPDEFSAIIDLTKKVDAETKITDLISKEDLTKLESRWKDPTTNTYYAGGYHGESWRRDVETPISNLPATIQPTTQVQNAAASKKVDPSFTGKIYCKELHKYVAADVVKDAAKMGAVVIDIESGAVNEVSFSSDSKVPENTQPDISTTQVIKRPEELAVDPAIIEAAKSSKEHLVKYASNDDLADNINAADAKSVEAIQPFALANRVRKYVYENAFIDGAKFYEERFSDSKQKNAQNIIRTAKAVIKILAYFINTFIHGQEDLKKGLELAIERGVQYRVTTKEAESLLSIGDKKDNLVLETLHAVISEGESDGKENTNKAF